MGYFIVWLLLSFLVALTGENKKMGYWGVFFVALLLSPLIGLIVGLLAAPKGAVVTGVSKADELEKFTRLRDSGALTQEEFDREKAGLLVSAPKKRSSEKEEFVPMIAVLAFGVVALILYYVVTHR